MSLFIENLVDNPTVTIGGAIVAVIIAALAIGVLYKLAATIHKAFDR